MVVVAEVVAGMLLWFVIVVCTDADTVVVGTTMEVLGAVVPEVLVECGIVLVDVDWTALEDDTTSVLFPFDSTMPKQ